MIGEGSAIRKYQSKLPTELSKRYGGSGPFTQAQIDRTVDDLGLSKRYIRYAYLMYCKQEQLDRELFSPENIEKMQGTISYATGGGIVAAPINMLFGAGHDDAGGFGDGGGGAE